MSESEKSETRGRRIGKFCTGFGIATAAAFAVMALPFSSTAWWIVCAAALAAATLCPLLLRRGHRYVVIGMLCALILPGLMVGSACIGIRLHY